MMALGTYFEYLVMRNYKLLARIHISNKSRYQLRLRRLTGLPGIVGTAR